MIETAIVGANVELYCPRTLRDGRLPPLERLWAHVWLMERDTVSADDVLAESHKMNRDNRADLKFTLMSRDVNDGYGDEWLEVYLFILHNCGLMVGLISALWGNFLQDNFKN
ncbi:unnamed protein product [Strongylus vulgaris]|uniref:Uncharacterized protein n=1 Tax=Strongylus vulgaris TaxID=40348 RepID=A0A3P7L1P3_STRVU|nr:unnamed protein product [Strongylus vulgaris]